VEPVTFRDLLVPALSVAFVVLALALVAVIIIAVVRGRSIDSSPVQIDIPKLGFALRGDRLTFLALLVCAVAFVPMAFWYQGYQAQLRDSLRKLENERQRADANEAALQRMKFYDLWVNPRLPDDIDVRQILQTVQIAISRPGGGPPRIERPQDVKVGPANDLWVHVDRLNPGDQFRVVIVEGSRRWASEAIEIPRTQVEMRRQ